MRKPKGSTTNRDALRSLMKKHSLTNAQVAEVAGVSVKTVESWVAEPKAASWRPMPERQLKAFKALLPDFLGARVG